jgi:hypothetical protein
MIDIMSVSMAGLADGPRYALLVMHPALMQPRSTSGPYASGSHGRSCSCLSYPYAILLIGNMYVLQNHSPFTARPGSYIEGLPGELDPTSRKPFRDVDVRSSRPDMLFRVHTHLVSTLSRPWSRRRYWPWSQFALRGLAKPKKKGSESALAYNVFALKVSVADVERC